MDRDRPLCLVGPRCAGKSTLGPPLARELGCPFVDLDDDLAADWARGNGARVESAGALLRRVGLDTFRRLESTALERVLAAGPAVVALGAGAVERPASRALLRERARCVWLRAEPELLRERLLADPADRPPVEGDDAAAELTRVCQRRAPLYAAVAHHAVEADARPEVVLRRVLRALESAARAPREPGEPSDPR